MGLEKRLRLQILYFTYLAKGGKTATADSPKGARDKDEANVGMLVSVGNPPPPGVPADTDPPVGLPLPWEFILDIIIIMLTIPDIPAIPATDAPPTCAGAPCAISSCIAGDAVAVGEAVKDKANSGACKMSKKLY